MAAYRLLICSFFLQGTFVTDVTEVLLLHLNILNR